MYFSLIVVFCLDRELRQVYVFIMISHSGKITKPRHFYEALHKYEIVTPRRA